MNLSNADLLAQLGNGESIDSVCNAAGISRKEFQAWWKKTIRSRVPDADGSAATNVTGNVSIRRDRLGIPHIFAENDHDLFFGFGWAMAEDRLFQLDWLRRKGLGRISEILGADGLEYDTVARTIGLNRIAQAEWERLSPEVQEVLEAFSEGINALIAHLGDSLPIEFDLLQYRPEPWSPIDSLAIENEFRWYLTGRFPVICIPELGHRALDESPLYHEFLLCELDEESILQPGEYEPSTSRPLEPVGATVNDPDASIGSNNWVVGGGKTASGAPLVASDPHIAFEAVSCWYEARLCGGSFDVAGMSYVGMPAIMFGRNKHVAWGITNNICSQRDLYQERTSSEHPDCFEYDGQWEPARELTETIEVKNATAVKKTIRFSRNGPIVDEILPPAAANTGPVSVKWLGMSQGGWLTSLLEMDRAKNTAEFREALRPWHVPTFSMVFADTDGHIGYHASGRVPVREHYQRAYRKGWDPADQWHGLIPFEEMPSLDNPERGWIATANNRTAPEDFPHKLHGCWASGCRGRRIRQMLEPHDGFTADDMREMQYDALNIRAGALVPALLNVVGTGIDDDCVRQAVTVLQEWDYQSLPESPAATIFNVFFSKWCETVSSERFEADISEFVALGIVGLAGRLFTVDLATWFAQGNREEQIRATFVATVEYLADRFGGEPASWTWDKLHVMPLKHVLAGRGDLGQLLNHGGAGVRGDMLTVCNTGNGPDWTAASGAGYRLISDLSTSPPSLRAVDGQSQSGHPGSPHYSDQFDDWINGNYHELQLTDDVEAETIMELKPKG